MSEARDDVLAKLEALLHKHAQPEPDIPVLTDLVEAPQVDLAAIPVLTEEVTPTAPEPIELDLVPEPLPLDAFVAAQQTGTVLAKLDAVEAEIQAEVNARIARLGRSATPAGAAPAGPSFELPPGSQYISLEGASPTVPESAGGEPAAETFERPAAEEGEPLPPPPAPLTLGEEALERIAQLVRAEVERALAQRIGQALAEQLPAALHGTLDRALSSMLDQFLMTLDEVVRSSIADELKKQLAPFRRPVSPKPPGSTS